MKALVLAGGISQAELIKDLKGRGIYTILADRNPKAYAVPYADKFYPISTMDIEAVKQLAVDEKVDFVITACADQVLLVVAQVSEELGLPCYIDFETAKIVSDKHYMKSIFKDFNVPTADFVVMDRLEEEKIAGFEYPLIVKPVDCYSSRGVKKVRNLNELKTAFNDAVNLSRTKTAIVEDFCEGIEVSADAMIINGKAHILAYSLIEKIKADNKFVICRNSKLINPPDDLKDKIAAAYQNIADGFHLRNAPMFAQMIYDGKKLRVLEFCARTGGCIKYRLLKLGCGYDFVKAVVDLTLGIKPDDPIPANRNNYVVNTFLYCKPGVFDHFEGIDDLVKSGVVYAVDRFVQSGSEFGENVTCSGDRIGSYTLIGDTEEEIQKKDRIVKEGLKAIDKNGNDMLNRELFYDYNSGVLSDFLR